MTGLLKNVGRFEKARYDWYQTEEFVAIHILRRNIDASKLLVTCENQTLTVTLPDWPEALTFQLSHDVKNEDLQTKVLPSKLEIKLPKVEGIRWKNLEGDSPVVAKHIPIVEPESKPNPKPKKNWDEVVKDAAVEDGDALQELFKKIYIEGTDETRMAMNKSFSESNGTVLSTNWGQVRSDKVETKPPQGVEFKKWD